MKFAGHARPETHNDPVGEPGGQRTCETRAANAARRFFTAIGAKP